MGGLFIGALLLGTFGVWGGIIVSILIIIAGFILGIWQINQELESQDIS